MCLDILINEYNRFLFQAYFRLGTVLGLGTQEKTRLCVVCFFRTYTLIGRNVKIVLVKQIINQKMTLDSE